MWLSEFVSKGENRLRRLYLLMIDLGINVHDTYDLLRYIDFCKKMEKK